MSVGTVTLIELDRKKDKWNNLDAWYGVEYDITSPATTLTRIGRSDLIAAQPIYNRFRTRVKRNDHTTAYTLSRQNHNMKEDGNAAVLSGVDGQVMTDMPMHYRKLESDGNIRRIKQSEYPLPGFSPVKKYGFGKYLASVDGGGLLASISGVLPATSLACDMASATGFGKRASNRGAGWSPVKYSAYADLCFCELVYTANFNAQTAISTGISDGISADWAARGYGGIKVTGNSNTKGDFTGSAPVTVTGWYMGATTSVVANKCMSTGRFASWNVAYVGMTIKNNVSLATATIVSKDSNDQLTLSADIFTASGQSFSIVESTYITQSAIFGGLEDFYGHLWQWMAGIFVNYENMGTGTAVAKAWLCNVASKMVDTLTADYAYLGDLSLVSGYVKKLLLGTMLPLETGGSSATYMADYAYISTTSGLRIVFVGGYVGAAADGGPRCSNSNYGPGAAGANVGSRLGLEYTDDEQTDA